MIFPPNYTFWCLDVGIEDHVRAPHFPGTSFSICLHDNVFRYCESCRAAREALAERAEAYRELQAILLTIGWLFGAA